ncbi:hypothetical protein I6U48_26410 [Clostridium sp. PL3]|uniref:Uncharacterized protein n=1 Tax=Clostridium thailandense TaxID=2794346 RepID=A0A949TW41_9CLOT|nr:hypothetical protein [Clostridium thailandense]MBV7276417.1 hypothetical protein [Clostridium thailandense]
MKGIPKLKKYQYEKIYKCLRKSDNHIIYSNAISVEAHEDILRDEIQGCLEVWLEGFKRGEYRINLF